MEMEGSETKSRRKDDEKKQTKKRLHVEMESVAESKNKIAPFVGYFPSGFDPLKHCKLENGEVGSEDPEIRVFRNEKFQSRLHLCHWDLGQGEAVPEDCSDHCKLDLQIGTKSERRTSRVE
ncbi:hypothetical protein MRB53_034935 [Persea americana]|uniref:Uncharacterized protein n=1 Tax=Persea americana TaxID=3435 RepID=A0ACC2K368_PERAE|nr:hypothetical protein MRB53_034935 [Persea americana]